MKMSTLTIIGSNGLIGRALVDSTASILSSSPAGHIPGITDVAALARRPLIDFTLPSKPEFAMTITPDIGASIPKSTTVLFSALGLTYQKAGSYAAQRAVDHHLTVEIAKKAKEKCEGHLTTYILVTALFANSNAWFEHQRIKGDAERDIIALGFDRTIILHPGAVLGTRHFATPEEKKEHDRGYYTAALHVVKFLLSTPILQRWVAAASVSDADIAKATIQLLKDTDKKGVEIYSCTDMRNLAKKYEEQSM
ncbi:uncharacterized protein V1518DRAFT_413619 [Limtongia smithiae]|uniref:uncharacterized protein n=1 Tax=Limtongia smithiae TaxID=1125753 RepID=UPI0034CE1422